MALSRAKINTHKKFGQSQHGFKLDEGNMDMDPKESELDFVRDYTYEQMFFAMNDLFDKLQKQTEI